MRFTQTCVVLGMLAVPTLASAQIKEPGNHPLYAVELEPHLIVEWNNYAPCNNDAFGPGFRAAINNGCGVYRGPNGYYGNGFTADVWSIPVVVQWNFFLLRKVSVFGEGGLVLQHTSFDNGYACTAGPGGFCTGTGTSNDVNPS